MESLGDLVVTFVPLVVRSSDAGPGRSVFSIDVASIDSSALPAPHDLDPVERGPAVPRLDKDRVPEIRSMERELRSLAPAMVAIAVVSVSVSSKILHLTPAPC